MHYSLPLVSWRIYNVHKNKLVTMHPAVRYLVLFGCGVSSMLAGAAVVHEVFKPNTNIPKLKRKNDI